jgi:hypothetical protein
MTRHWRRGLPFGLPDDFAGVVVPRLHQGRVSQPGGGTVAEMTELTWREPDKAFWRRWRCDKPSV